MIDHFRLNRRRALITGSVRGIGLALARGLAQAGAQVVLNGRDPERAQGACALLRDEGLDAEYAVFDVTDHHAVATAVDALEKRLGPIDILVNNAGLQHRQALQDVSAEDWNRLMNTNLNGVFNVSTAVARHMIARQRGKIINIGSVQSELARPLSHLMPPARALCACLPEACVPTGRGMACRSMRWPPVIFRLN